MEYSLRDQKLQDIVVKTIRLTARAQELGSVAANVLTIPLAQLSADAIATTDVLVARNITDSTTLTVGISSGNLTLTDVALATSDVIDLVIRVS